MNPMIGARFTMHWTLTIEKLYHHLFSTLGNPRAIIDHLKHDLALWLEYHSFEELSDTLDLDMNLTTLDCLDCWESWSYTITFA